jgi:integrase
MATVLTVQSVLRAKPDPSRRVEIPDAIVPGLYFVVQPSGVKSWAVRYRHRGEPRKLTIGRLGVFDLVAARDEARKALQAVAAGRDPCLDKREARRAVAAHPGRDLVSTHVEAFLARYVRPQTKARTAAETERRLRKYVLPQWGERRVQEITRRDVIELLDGIVDTGKPITANRTLTTLKTLFGWLMDRSVIDASPCTRVKAPAAENSRDRVLSDDELALLWRAAGDLGAPYGGFARTLLLTAQRRDEVAGMRRSELKVRDLWTIPSARTKNGVEHDVPLSDEASAIIAAAPQIGGEGFTFTVNGSAPITGYSIAKTKLDARMRELAREADPDAPEIPRWTFHDLRRTAASGMARLGFAVHVIEAVLNHTGGEISGVTAVYNRHKYLAEKRRALDTWAAYVMGLVNAPAASNVVALRGRT